VGVGGAADERDGDLVDGLGELRGSVPDPDHLPVHPVHPDAGLLGEAQDANGGGETGVAGSGGGGEDVVDGDALHERSG